MKTLFRNGKIYVEKGVYAQAVLVEDGWIRAVGTEEEVLAAADSGFDGEMIDCEGRTVIPGLNDSHLHLRLLGLQLSQVQIVGVKSIDHLVQVCREIRTCLRRGKSGCRTVMTWTGSARRFQLYWIASVPIWW